MLAGSRKSVADPAAASRRFAPPPRPVAQSPVQPQSEESMKNTHTLAASALAALALLTAAAPGHAQAPPLKVGLMLPATGTFAALGDAIEKGFRLHVQEQRRQARRPLDRILQGRRRERPQQGHRQRQQADQARQRRRHRRHRALGRRAGDGARGQGKRHAADRPQRRRRRHHRAAVREEHLPQQLLATGSRATAPASSRRRRATRRR